MGIGAGAGNGLCVKIREAEELYEGKELNLREGSNFTEFVPS